MNRRNLLGGLVAALFGQNTRTLEQQCGHGNYPPCPEPPLKEGEEYCPLQHAQKPAIVDLVEDKPKMNLANLTVMEARYCTVCGIVYCSFVKSEEKKP